MPVREYVLKDASNLGKSIVTYRAKHNLSQKEFAKKVGLSTQTIYMIEANLQTPTKVTTEKIILVLEEDEQNESQHKQNQDV